MRIRQWMRMIAFGSAITFLQIYLSTMQDIKSIILKVMALQNERLTILDFNHETFELVKETDMYVRSAVYDPRNVDQPVVRLLALTPMNYSTVYCHIKYEIENTTFNVVEVVEAEVIVQKVHFESYCKWVTAGVICPFSNSTHPESVSISANDTYSPNPWFRIKIPEYKPPEKPKYGICMNSIFYLKDDDIHMLVEWLEMNRLLGVHNVMVYGTFNVSTNILKVLQYYIDLGFIIYHPWKLPMLTLTPADYKKNQTLKSIDQCVTYFAQHLIYMDCLYRYVDDFTYLANIDTDEYILPAVGNTWADMFAKIESEKELQEYASYNIQEACFDRTYNSSNFVKNNGTDIYLVTKAQKSWPYFRYFTKFTPHFKSIMRPQYVVRVYIHMVRVATEPFKKKVKIDTSIARMNHYRRPNGACGKEKDLTARDNFIYKYHSALVPRMGQALEEILGEQS